jgi:hypothetical protein
MSYDFTYLRTIINLKPFIMKTICKLLLVSMLLLATSCSKESVTDPIQENLSATAVKAGTKVTRPVSIDIQVLGNENGEYADFWGKMSHLGKIDGTTTYTGIDWTSPSTFTYNSVDIVNAANKDQVFSHTVLYFSFFSADQANYTGTTTFDGGTGRFEGATGSMEIDGLYTITGVDINGAPRGLSVHKGHGTITY